MEKYLKLGPLVGLDVYKQYLNELSLISNREPNYKILPLESDRSNGNYFWEAIEQLKYKTDLCKDTVNKLNTKLSSIETTAVELGVSLAGDLQKSNSSIARFYIAKNRGAQYKAIDLRNTTLVDFFDPKKKEYVHGGSQFDSGLTSIIKDNNLITAISFINKDGSKFLEETNSGRFLVSKYLPLDKVDTEFCFHIELNGYSYPQWIYFESDFKDVKLKSIQIVTLSRPELLSNVAINYSSFMETDTLSGTDYKEAFDGFNRGSFVLIPASGQDVGIKHIVASFKSSKFSTVNKNQITRSSILDSYMALTDGEEERFDREIKLEKKFDIGLKSIACGRFDNSEDKVFTSQFRLEKDIKEIELVQSSKGAVESYIELMFYDNADRLVWKETAPIEASKKDISEVWSSTTQPGTSMDYEVNNYNSEILFPVNGIYSTSFRVGELTETNSFIIRLIGSYNVDSDDGIEDRVFFSIDQTNWFLIGDFNSNRTYRDQDKNVQIKIIDPTSEELNSPISVFYPKYEASYKTAQQGLEYKVNNMGLRIVVPVEYSYSVGKLYSICRYSNSPVYSHYSSYGDEMPLIKSSYLLVK